MAQTVHRISSAFDHVVGMPGSSELSDALNPYFYHQEQQSQANLSPSYDQHPRVPVPFPPDVAQQSAVQPFTSHRSELANAINPAAVSPSVAACGITLKQSRQPAADPIQLLKGLIQSIASYKAAVEQEKKRRLTWEQEQETKHLARQAELENRVVELQHEIDTLRAEHGVLRTSPESPAQPGQVSPSAARASSQALKESVMLFEPNDGETNQPEFVEGSSLSVPASTLKKRARSGSPNDASEHEPMKLRTHRISRPQTIQTAMRNHILRCMDLDHDKELPAPHDETVNLPPTRPVRFVWDQTTKKSAHNAKMKARIVRDMIVNRELYPLVPSQEFTKGKLDGVFEQAYTTLRQKYATQQGLKVNSKDRIEIKSRKARRLSRKKTKLANRIATRENLEEYSLPTFDAAFQIDCMSSEESSEGEEEAEEASDGGKLPGLKVLHIRYLAWRSTRLQQLFHTIDKHEERNRVMKPKRGLGRKDRHMGLPKDGNPPPPKGVPQWMVSKKWLRQASAVNQQISTLVDPDDEGAAQALSTLGAESEDEEAPRQQDYIQMPLPLLPLVEPIPPINPDAFPHAQYMYAQHTAWADTMAGYVDLSQISSPVLQTYPSGVSDSS